MIVSEINCILFFMGGKRDTKLLSLIACHLPLKQKKEKKQIIQDLNHMFFGG